MYKDILNTLRQYPGLRKRELSAILHIPLMDVVIMVSELEKIGKVYSKPYRDFANMEYYDKYYATK